MRTQTHQKEISILFCLPGKCLFTFYILISRPVSFNYSSFGWSFFLVIFKMISWYVGCGSWGRGWKLSKEKKKVHNIAINFS